MREPPPLPSRPSHRPPGERVPPCSPDREKGCLSMCGIAGFVLPQPGMPRREIEARLWAMIGTLRHRGPDDEGVWTDGRGASGACPAVDHRPVAGRAPADRERRRRCVADLQRRGLQLRRVARRAQRARLCLPQPHRQRGRRQRLARLGRAALSPAARHVRAGLVGPAHAAGWCWRATGSARSRSITRGAGGAPAFCSAPRSRRCWPGRGCRASPTSARSTDYLTLQYVPSPETAFVGVSRLPPAHYLIVEAEPAAAGASGAGALLGVAGAAHRRAAAEAGRSCTRSWWRMLRRGGAAAHDRRRAARRLPVGRRRFERASSR